jgi:hypothetical protein
MSQPAFDEGLLQLAEFVVQLVTAVLAQDFEVQLIFS